jgi:hypothetical protein
MRRPGKLRVQQRFGQPLIDPNAAPVRSLSREERELMIAANNGYVLAFDNLSGLPQRPLPPCDRRQLRRTAALHRR